MKRRKFVLLSSSVGTAIVLKAFGSYSNALNPEFISGANSLHLIWNQDTIKDIGTNLFVAGAACYPTSGAPNPTLTLTALTLRLSDHIKQNFKT